MAELCYLEYGVDPENLSQAHRDFHRAGFRLRSKNSTDTVRFYSQGSAVIMLRILDGQAFDFIGVGLAGSPEEVRYIEGNLDTDTNFTVGSDGHQRVTVIETHQVNELIEQQFEIQQQTDQKGAGINYFSGLVLPTRSKAVESVWNNLGFDISKRGDWSDTAISAKRRFTVMFADVERPLIVADTNLIFDVVSNYLLAGIESPDSQKPSENFNHPNATKARAYECAIFGNQESYSVEKYYPRALGNTDFVVRQRRQYIHIPEENLKAHYASIEDKN